VATLALQVSIEAPVQQQSGRRLRGKQAADDAQGDPAVFAATPGMSVPIGCFALVSSVGAATAGGRCQPPLVCGKRASF
jgi:hypothetical protein